MNREEIIKLIEEEILDAGRRKDYYHGKFMESNSTSSRIASEFSFEKKIILQELLEKINRIDE